MFCSFHGCFMSHDLGPGTFESHWFFLGYCDGVAGGLGKTRRKARGGLIPPLVLHGREKKWPAWLYRIRRPTFILRMVAHLRASAARTILKTCLRCFDAIFRRAEAGPGRAEAWAGRAEAQNGGFLIWIYQKIGEIWSWAGRGPKWGLLNK